MFYGNVVPWTESLNRNYLYKAFARKNSLQKYWLYWLFLGVISELTNYIFIEFTQY